VDGSIIFTIQIKDFQLSKTINEQIYFKFKVDHEKTFGSFFSNTNELVITELRNIFIKNGSWIYISGNTGTGISHLLQAAFNMALQNNINSTYLNVNEILDSLTVLSSKDLSNYFDGLECHDFVCIDDIDKISNNPHLEEQVFYLLERIKNNSKTNLLIGAHVNASQIKCNLKDLHSRLKWALGLNLKEIPDDQNLNFLKFKTSRLGLEITDDVANYLLRRCGRGVLELSKVVDTIDSYSLKKGRAVTIPLVKEALSF